MLGTTIHGSVASEFLGINPVALSYIIFGQKKAAKYEKLTSKARFAVNMPSPGNNPSTPDWTDRLKRLQIKFAKV